MQNAVVIGGLGMVGQATRHAFGIEKYIDLRGSTATYKEAGEAKYVFLCLPTPCENGRYNIDSTIEAIKTVLANQVGQTIFILRSTVTPGTTRHLCEMLGINSIVFNPEFLSEKTWKSDTDHPDVVVIGADHNQYADEVIALYQGRFKGLNIQRTDSVTAELIKLSINAFYATKVVFANQIFDHAQKIGANYEKIKEVMYARKWIGKNHLDIFHNDCRGAGGKCLEKDLQAFAEYSQLPLLITANKLNKALLGKKQNE